MVNLEIIKEIAQSSPAKIVLLVIDGLGGLPHPETGKTELETARTPNLDELASKGECGLIDPVMPGVIPGSSPGHLALFGYDPVSSEIGRGALEAIGIGFDLQVEDVAARGNFCTIDRYGLVTDRRAGRISTERCAELCKLLDNTTIGGVKVFVRPVKEHRLVAVFRGEGLASSVSDSDPQQTGVEPKLIIPLTPAAKKMADIANRFNAKAKKILAKHHPANMVLLRGFSKRPLFADMEEVYKLKPAAIATYPMYRGLAQLVGMEVLETGTSIKEEFRTLKENYPLHDFFFLHIKGADTAGEDGDFERKVKVIEEFDKALPQVLELNPEVIVVTGDHSTPATYKGHSWHPVPVLLYSPWCRSTGKVKFGESDCALGRLGRLPATNIMPLALAHAGKLTKFGA